LDDLGGAHGVGREAGSGVAVEDLVGDARGALVIDRFHPVGVDGLFVGVEPGDRDLQQVGGAEGLGEADGGSAVGHLRVEGVGLGARSHAGHGVERGLAADDMHVQLGHLAGDIILERAELVVAHLPGAVGGEDRDRDAGRLFRDFRHGGGEGALRGGATVLLRGFGLHRRLGRGGILSKGVGDAECEKGDE
jgi:hypothetical protein